MSWKHCANIQEFDARFYFTVLPTEANLRLQTIESLLWTSKDGILFKLSRSAGSSCLLWLTCVCSCKTGFIPHQNIKTSKYNNGPILKSVLNNSLMSLTLTWRVSIAYYSWLFNKKCCCWWRLSTSSMKMLLSSLSLSSASLKVIIEEEAVMSNIQELPEAAWVTFGRVRLTLGLSELQARLKTLNKMLTI